VNTLKLFNNMIAVVQYCWAINDWKERLHRQLKRVKDSGLYDEAEELHLFVTDNVNRDESVVKELMTEFPKYNLHYDQINRGEAVMALTKVHSISLENENAKILYFHTKGVFNRYSNFQKKEISEEKIKCSDRSVDLFEYFLIDRWKLFVDALDENDMAGVTCNNRWWWANFWWANDKHIKKLDPFDKYYGGSRWQAESWVYDSYFLKYKETIKKFEAWRNVFDYRRSFIPKYFYNNQIDKKIKFTIKKAEYGYKAVQSDEGQGLRHHEDILIDVTDKVIQIFEENNNEFKPFEINDTIFGIQHEILSNGHIIPGPFKNLSFEFTTNIDPENVYVLTTNNGAPIILPI